MKKICLPCIVLVFVLLISYASAVVISSVDSPTLSPGEEGNVRIEVKNTLNEDVNDVTIILNFKDIPFIPIGTSEQSTDEIEEDDEDIFVFRIKASPTIIPGDYEIPYVLEYIIDNNERSRSGTIGIKVRANPELTFSIETENPIQNEKGKITLRMVNKGFYDARFVSVKIFPEGFTILSKSESYIGEISSDDFETVTFDVVFNTINPDFVAMVEYKDFDNKIARSDINIPVKVYTRKKAIELGIIKKNNTLFYVAGAVVLVIMILIWRIIRRRRRRKKRERDV